MSTPIKSSSLQTYQTIVYDRALHPELFQLRDRRIIRHAGYSLESWLMRGGHILRFEYDGHCATELVTDQESNLPATGVIQAFLCAGERDYEHTFARSKITYMTSVQTETLSENLYQATYEEISELARCEGALRSDWSVDEGRCLSVLDVQRYNHEVHAQAYHMIAAGGLVLRTQTIFEHR
ncbi:MAG: hypothetical protein H6811_04270 [Phycisphaeraceae bacterium]|nr:hypothetical protein [Phycisphaeraceae bacterium]